MLPPIPAKRYFTIGEVSELCGVKPYVLRYWEQEFTQLKPMKRRGNRRYYQHHEVLLIRRIRDLLYDQGFTISGARNRLGDALAGLRAGGAPDEGGLDDVELAHEVSGIDAGDGDIDAADLRVDSVPALGAAEVLAPSAALSAVVPLLAPNPLDARQLRTELLSIRELLGA